MDKTNEKLKEELQSLKQAVAAAETKFKETKANGELDEKFENLYEMYSSVYRYASRLEDTFYSYMYEHTKGHLPPIVGADKMNKALKACGLDGDYKAEPKHVYASLNTLKYDFSK